WGIRQISDLTWVTPPPAGPVSQAVELLEALGAVQGSVITERGREMLRLPSHPRIAHMLIEARHAGQDNVGALALATDIAAILEERDPMPRGTGADLSLRIELLRRWRKGERPSGERNFLERIERLALSWRHIFGIQVDNSVVSDSQVGKWLMAAYPERIAKQTEKHGERYKMVNGRTARLPEHDPLHREPWLAIAQVDAGIHEGKIFMAAPILAEDLIPLAVEKEMVSWDADREMVVASLELRLGNLVLSAKPLTKIGEEKKVEVFCAILREKGLSLLNWQEEQSAWQARVLSLRRWRPEEGWPDVSDENLRNTAEQWLAPFLLNLYKRSELQKLDLNTILPTLLPWQLNSRFPQLAPARMAVPSGSMIKLNYFPDGRPPVMEVRLQEVFGLMETPAVNDGRNKVVMHLLSPGYKPVQVTQDLKSFWTNTYAEVRKELKTRYPKHSWPEDPWTAEAVRGAKRKR
ncbi:MAG: ATP-dependent helicase C-terminal domain-containing protein, partial [Cyclobacteriaceae bacterium]